MEMDESMGSRVKPWWMWVLVAVLVLLGGSGYLIQRQKIAQMNEQEVTLKEEMQAEASKASVARAAMAEEIKKLKEEVEAERSRAGGLSEKWQAVQGELAQLKGQKDESDRWKGMLSQALDATQDVFAMKMAVNDPVLAELENQAGWVLEVCERWEVMINSLEGEEDFAKEVAQMKIRLAQAYAGMGMVEKVNLDGLDWKAAGMEMKRADLLARIYYTLADRMLAKGEEAKAQEYLTSCREIAAELPEEGFYKDYVAGSIHLLEARLLTKNPREAMDLYMKAIKQLRKVAVGMPGKLAFRCRFAEACLDGALLIPGGASVGHGEQLRKEAHAHAYWLAKKHPELKIAHRVNAQIDLEMAEEQLRGGQEGMVEPLLERAEESVKKAGGDVAISAGIKAVRSFMLWDRGQRAKAHEMMSSEIKKLGDHLAEHPADVEVSYRLASLMWERSSMRAKPEDALKDGHDAAQVLVELIKQGAGKRDAASRRILAIILSDIGHLAISFEQKKLAKQYFEQALAQWIHLREKWGDSDEYSEGIRWCKSQLKGL